MMPASSTESTKGLDMENLKHRIEELELKISSMEHENRSVFTKTLDELKAKKADVETRFSEIKAAGENASKELKAGLEMAWDDLKLTFETAYNRLMH